MTAKELERFSTIMRCRANGDNTIFVNDSGEYAAAQCRGMDMVKYYVERPILEEIAKFFYGYFPLEGEDKQDWMKISKFFE